MNKKIITIISSIITIALLIISFFILPDQVVMQIGLDGNPTTILPKISGILLPFVISVIGIVSYNIMQDNEKKYLVIILIGYICSILTFIMN